MKALLLRGADIDAQTSYGYTALMIAALNGHGGCVAGLIKSGAEVDVSNLYGQTALTCAAATGRVECSTLLLDAGANPKLADIHGRTAADLSERWDMRSCGRELGGCSDTLQQLAQRCSALERLRQPVGRARALFV